MIPDTFPSIFYIFFFLVLFYVNKIEEINRNVHGRMASTAISSTQHCSARAVDDQATHAEARRRCWPAGVDAREDDVGTRGLDDHVAASGRTRGRS